MAGSFPHSRTNPLYETLENRPSSETSVTVGEQVVSPMAPLKKRLLQRLTESQTASTSESSKAREDQRPQNPPSPVNLFQTPISQQPSCHAPNPSPPHSSPEEPLTLEPLCTLFSVDSRSPSPQQPAHEPATASDPIILPDSEEEDTMPRQELPRRHH